MTGLPLGHWVPKMKSAVTRAGERHLHSYGARPKGAADTRWEFLSRAVRVSAPAAPIAVMMSNRWHLIRFTLGSPEIPKTPAAQALALKLVSEMDLLRLKAIARLHARGLPPEVDWTDLLQEAFARLLDRSRKCPEGVPVVVFLAGIMRSIRTDCCRRARRAAARLPHMLCDFGLGERPGAEAADPSPDPERSLMAMQQLGEIHLNSPRRKPRRSGRGGGAL